MRRGRPRHALLRAAHHDHRTPAEREAAQYKYKLRDAMEALETLSLFVRRGTPRQARAALRDLKRILTVEGEPTPDECSFCDEKAVTGFFAVAACAPHRLAFIDGKIGENACISIREHKLMTALKKFVDECRHEVRFESLDRDRPEGMLKGKARR